MAKPPKEIKVDLKLDGPVHRAMVEKLREYGEEFVRRYFPTERMNIVQDDEPLQPVWGFDIIRANIYDAMKKDADKFEASLKDVAASMNMTPKEMDERITAIKGLKISQIWEDEFTGYTSTVKMPKPEGQMKPKWNTEQILAEAHLVDGQYQHDRRKYRYSMSTTGCMRVPAALVVEMLSHDPQYWQDKAEQFERECGEGADELKLLRIGSKQGKKWIARAKDAEARLAILEKPGSAVVRDISPEERAVIEAARELNREYLGTKKNLGSNFSATARPLFRAILALHEAGEKHTGIKFSEVVTQYTPGITDTSPPPSYFSDAEREHVGTGSEMQVCTQCSRVLNHNTGTGLVRCRCGNTLHFA